MFSALFARARGVFNPTPRPSFLCSAKEKRGIERRPRTALAPRRWRGVPCAARQGGHAQNSLRSLRSLRSNKLRESDHEVRLRRTAPLSALLGGAEGVSPANSQQPDLDSLTALAGAQTHAGNELTAGCSVFGCSVSHPLCAAEQRRRPARVPQARIPSDSRSLFEPEVAQRLEASSARGRASSSTGNPSPAARGERSVGPPLDSPLFFGGAKKRGPGLSKERARPTAGLATPCEGLAACRRRDAGSEVLLGVQGRKAPGCTRQSRRSCSESRGEAPWAGGVQGQKAPGRNVA